MKYIAHVGILLKEGNTSVENDEWRIIKKENGLEYQWRVQSNHILEVAAGLFNDKESALKFSKEIFVSTVFYLFRRQIHIEDANTWIYESRFYREEQDGSFENYEKNETFFYWNKHYQGNPLGPGVYEVENSMNELAEYKSFDVSWSVQSDRPIDLSMIDREVFIYSRENQAIIDALILADKTYNLGIKMTLYCGILEHLAGEYSKDDDVVTLIDRFVEETEESQLPPGHKKQLKDYLNGAKKESAKQRCKNLCLKYTNKKYNDYTTDQIVNAAYKIRSTFSHGGAKKVYYSPEAESMKYVVLDVVEAYMQEKEGKDVTNGRECV